MAWLEGVQACVHVAAAVGGIYLATNQDHLVLLADL